MRGFGLGLTVASLVRLAGCGYVGEPLPPALNRPVPVTDLTAVELGRNIVVQFTIPKVTTENLPIRGSADIEVRIGPLADIPTWERNSERVSLAPGAQSTTAHAEIPASKYYGQTVMLAVNVHGPRGRSAGWSNFRSLRVVPALPTPERLQAKNVSEGVLLEWQAAAPEFRVFRKLVADRDWLRIGISPAPSWTDKTIEYGNTYQYYVQAQQKTDEDTYALSEESEVETVKPIDTFPPAVPAGLSAVPGTRSIELVWQRNTEKDFASYRIYRDGEKIADGVTAPAYSDRDVQPGAKHRYQVSAVDTAGNESDRSAMVEAAIP